MDYEKKYKEALEKAKRLYGEGTITECLCHIFPELKEFVDEKIRKLLIRLFTSNTNEKFDDVSTEEIIAWLEKQGNADNIEPKIEPKFHKGEWVVWQDKFYKVNYNGCGYELIDQNGLSTSLEYGTVDENAHLFTIQDAKDGDVLSYVTNEEDLWIMIYLSLYEPYEGHVHYHALLVNDNFTDKGTCCICINDLKPATKEQRDLLFQKMKEACYKWDAEKKELKKIEFQDSAWSEEDEHRVKDTIYFLDTAKKHYASTVELDACIDWLKSLKQRIGG